MTDLVDRARDFARAAHAGQVRKCGRAVPYFVHLAEVAAFVRRHGGPEEAQAAAWLHDTVEDCAVSHADLVREFGDAVAALVAEVTDDQSLPKAERKRQTILLAPKKSPHAAMMKMGDMASNTASVGLSPPTFWDDKRRLAYLDWASEVLAALPNHWPAARAETGLMITRSRTLIEAMAL